MKIYGITWVLTLLTSLTFAAQIEATVIFENLTEKTFISGQLTIHELNKQMEVGSLENLRILLPGKGTYQFSFESEDFTAFVFYPAKITPKHSTITIRLVEKSENRINTVFGFPLNLETDLSEEQIEDRISAGSINFIIHGIDSSIPEEYVLFQEKYGIGLLKENCVIDPLSFKKASENNRMIADFLTKKYGDAWLDDLMAKPLGIK